MASTDSITLVAGRGIREDTRYFKKSTRRQVTLMAREEITDHANALAAGEFPPGAVRANVETSGIDLQALVGHELQLGTAVLSVYEARIPCAQMDDLCQGLRERMSDGHQGVLAQIKISGTARVGDLIRPIQVKENGSTT